MPWYRRPTLPTVVSVAIGITSAWAAELITHEGALRLIIGMLAGVAALQLGELWQVHARTPLLSKLEEILTAPALYRQVETMVEANSRIALLTNRHEVCRRLFEMRRDDCLSTTTIAMQELAGGRLSVSDPDQQYKFAVDLVGLARHSVRAVSYRDEEFWTLLPGARYLELNEKLIAGSGVVQRVFVLESEAKIIAQRSVIETHASKKIEAYVLLPQEQRPADREDFVLYDDSFVRFAQPIEYEGSKKRATLSLDEVDVRRYADKFQDLLLRSVLAKSYFEELDKRNTLEEQRWSSERGSS